MNVTQAKKLKLPAQVHYTASEKSPVPSGVYTATKRCFLGGKPGFIFAEHPARYVFSGERCEVAQ